MARVAATAAILFVILLIAQSLFVARRCRERGYTHADTVNPFHPRCYRQEYEP